MKINPIVLSIPVFFILIGIELLVERFSHRKLYRLPDAISNISCGITSQLSGLFLKVLGIGVYQLLFEKFRFVTLDNTTWWYWLSLILLVDFAYYWAHRMSHEVNLFWGGHVVHHQSEEYNLSVALRQSSLQIVWTFAFNLPIALMGFGTMDFLYVSAFNTLYQFWIHTETIGKFPRWIEFVFNTPSHHRVHHGRNPKYIDRNHAGSLIIWDRMFGTFQEEEERPTYGITKPLNSWNAVWANMSHYAEMGKDLKRIPSWGDRLKYLFKKPGWLPEYLGGYRPAPEVDREHFRKYDTPSPLSLNLYVLFQYILCLIGTGIFLNNADKFSLGDQSLITLLVTVTVVNCGVLFEQRKWVKWSEWIRIFTYPLLLSILTALLDWPVLFQGLSFLYFLISFIWFYSLQRQHEHVQMA
ncbi:MAG TPA: sterol desaturase family protein [Chryseosolibacter sp.]|nr:sterol desaturase family protein [Chryseosolibacter sp.]